MCTCCCTTCRSHPTQTIHKNAQHITRINKVRCYLPTPTYTPSDISVCTPLQRNACEFGHCAQCLISLRIFKHLSNTSSKHNAPRVFCCTHIANCVLPPSFCAHQVYTFTLFTVVKFYLDIFEVKLT